MASSTVDRETLLQNMRAAVSTLTSGLANWSIDDMLAPRAENCEHEILPKSMGIPPSTNQQFREFFEGNMRDVMSDVKMNTISTLFDPSARAAVLHFTSSASSVVGPVENEYVVMLFFDERGETVVRVREFVDSAVTQNFFKRLGELEATQAQGGDEGKGQK